MDTHWCSDGMFCCFAMSTAIRFVFKGHKEQSNMFSSENTMFVSFSNSFHFDQWQWFTKTDIWLAIHHE